jgi:uncharacterized protein YutD
MKWLKYFESLEEIDLVPGSDGHDELRHRGFYKTPKPQLI